VQITRRHQSCEPALSARAAADRDDVPSLLSQRVAGQSRLLNEASWSRDRSEVTSAWWPHNPAASSRCTKVFSETDHTEDLRKFDIPTLVLHGDDDQIVPIGASAMLSSKLIKNAQLKIYKGAPHGMCSTHKDQVNADLLSFLRV
jgi:pimeloyl-ACP methyl ester carboxylesterase